MELAYWKAKIAEVWRPTIEIMEYEPRSRTLPSSLPQVESAWKGIESILEDLLTQFGIPRNSCLEFGVEHGYSTAAFATLFAQVTGVDTFAGDVHTVDHGDFYAETAARLAAFPNIHLVRSDYRHWIAKDLHTYDLIHVDIVHNYVDTYACGLWAAQHAKCVLFHDTESFPAVKQAMSNIGRKTGRRLHNYKGSYGLGILV